eukprot:5451878-Prorocentrum_lima.AAC.1
MGAGADGESEQSSGEEVQPKKKNLKHNQSASAQVEGFHPHSVFVSAEGKQEGDGASVGAKSAEATGAAARSADN